MIDNNEFPLVAILVVNWNKKKDLLNLLSALQGLDYPQKKIFVVDNASTDGSVDAVREEYSEVALVQNKENLGGTGGFNTGINYILEKSGEQYDYIWLLDNDVMIDALALSELVKVAESDPRIGLAGSKIMNPENPEMIVELGSNIDLRKGFVKPFLRNTPDRKGLKDYYDVDYVAVCSALVRVAAFKNVGIMDERYFIFWDDMDWGITFKRNGYRVVAVNRSIVFHPAFSEKGSLSGAMVYYKYRNPLLMMSKHAKLSHRIFSLSNRGRKTIAGIFFFWATGRPHTTKIMMLSIFDFLRNKWGQFNYSINSSDEDRVYIQNISDHKRFIIIAAGNKSLFMKTIHQIRKQVDNPYIALMVAKDRMSLFSDIKVEDIIVRDPEKHHTMINRLKTLRIFIRGKFDLGVVSPEQTFGYLSHTVKNICSFDDDKNLFKLDQSRGSLWKLVISFLIGELVSCLILPIILLFSFRYKVKISKKI